MLRRRSEFSFERGPCDRERDRSWIHVTFHFMFHFPVLHVVFKQTLPKTNRSFHFVVLVQSFVARCCKMQCVHDAKQLGKVTVRITEVMVV